MKKISILVAEDNEIASKFFYHILKPISNQIYTVKTGIEAINLCKQHPDIDLILMDIRMPEMDGIEAIKNIRQFNKKVIIIIQTAGSLYNIDESEIDEFILKPIHKEDLFQLIGKFFDI